MRPSPFFCCNRLLPRARRWNAARSFARYLDSHSEEYRGKYVLELGAGGGLPGIVAAKNGAKKVKHAIRLEYSLNAPGGSH
jgi:predicted nicotinamide N-methyase